METNTANAPKEYVEITQEQYEIALQILKDEGYEPKDVIEDEFGNEYVYYIEDGDDEVPTVRYRRYLYEIK